MGVGAGWFLFHRSQHASPGLPKAKPIRLGGLVGYYFDRAIVQAYVTSDVYEKNYGGRELRGSLRVIIPLGDPAGGPPPPAVPVAQ